MNSSRRDVGTTIVMGVAGCGKSTIGRLLAERLDIDYAEADTFHPPANIARMSQGIPLTDEDRRPWLDAIATRIRHDECLVVSCSALKRAYRDILRPAGPNVRFLHLGIDRGTATARVASRSDHFMPMSLVDSQFDTLEPLRDETGLTVDATHAPEQIIIDVLNSWTLHAVPIPIEGDSSSRNLTGSHDLSSSPGR
jgi:gluconokinase